jgi:hypothetical protein
LPVKEEQVRRGIKPSQPAQASVPVKADEFLRDRGADEPRR